MRPNLANFRALALLGAVIAAAIGLFAPKIQLQRRVLDVLAIVDVTVSMTTKDMSSGGAPQPRIDAAKAAIIRLLEELPCGSRLGLGIFTERRTFVLFDPVDTCAGFAPLEIAVGDLDWRMAWEGDSYVTKGLYNAIEEAAILKSNILFLTDGHEAPPLPPASGNPPFEGKPDEVRGLIVGVGSREKSPIPKFDDEGREVGVYGPQDVVQENRTGAPPPDAASRPGYHPKWAPFGSGPPVGDEHLTNVRGDHLKSLAAATGLAYAELNVSPSLLGPLMASSHTRSIEVTTDLRPYASSIALFLLLASYAGSLMRDVARSIATSRGSIPTLGNLRTEAS